MTGMVSPSIAVPASGPLPSHPPSHPPYARVKQFLKDGLAAGRWAPGALMPSEAELVAQFGVSRMTVNRALRELQADGLVQRTQGVGTFAAPLHRLAAPLAIRDLHEELVERGQQHTTDVQLCREERAPAALAERLGLKAGARVFHVLLLHRCNGVPLQCEDRYVVPAWAPDFLETDFHTTTPTHVLLQCVPQWEGQYSIEAATPTAQEAQLLQVAPGDPCLVVVRRTESRGKPITLARLVHPGQRYSIEGRFKP
jgi:GntR family histidine utilization transcriptional repressor